MEMLWQLRAQRRQSSPELPETVTCLTAPDGSLLYLVGTAHFSDSSKKDVATVRIYNWVCTVYYTTYTLLKYDVLWIEKLWCNSVNVEECCRIAPWSNDEVSHCNLFFPHWSFVLTFSLLICLLSLSYPLMLSYSVAHPLRSLSPSCRPSALCNQTWWWWSCASTGCLCWRWTRIHCWGKPKTSTWRRFSRPSNRSGFQDDGN